METIKPELNGVAETMLQTIYARAQYSKQKKHIFYDEKAIEIVKHMDYDFSLAGKDKAMKNGTIARTFVFDELVSDFITKHPEAVIVNIACGLDTRYYRLDNGKITWYNLDLPETIKVRKQYFEENDRVSMIGMSVLDSYQGTNFDTIKTERKNSGKAHDRVCKSAVFIFSLYGPGPVP